MDLDFVCSGAIYLAAITGQYGSECRRECWVDTVVAARRTVAELVVQMVGKKKMSGKKKTARVTEHDSGRVRTTPAATRRSASERRDELACVSALRDVVRYVEKCDTTQASH